MTKGQALAEFLVVFSAFLFLLLAYSSVFSEYTIAFFSSNNYLKLFSLSYRISSAINSVFIAGDGTAYSFSLDVQNIALTTDKNILTLTLSNKSTTSSTLITENVSIAQNIDSDFLIVNNGGIIEVS